VSKCFPLFIQTLANDLAGGGFIAQQRNVVLVGGTGTGKTHLAIAIARSCIRDGARGRFYNVVDLVNRLETETRNGRQGRIAEHLTRMDFIVLDELGYLPFTQSGGQLLFHLVSRPLTSAPPLSSPSTGDSTLAKNPRTDAGLAAILRDIGLIPAEPAPKEALDAALLSFQRANSRIPPAEYGNPAAATTLWFLTQAELKFQVERSKTGNH
jgi:IstB-like ATP binding protein